MQHVRRGHWRHTPTGSVFIKASTVGETTPEEQKKLDEIRQRREEMEKRKAEEAAKKKRSDAAKKVWETIRRKKAEAEALKAKKKKFRSIDDEGTYGG